MELDCVIKNGRVVTASEILPLGIDIGIRDGRIVFLGTIDQHLKDTSATTVIDADGAYVTPGGVDAHVHIEQSDAPAGDTWETGTRSAIAGGSTTIIAFAYQERHHGSLLPVIEAYHAKAEHNAYCDYGFHVILTNPTQRILEEELPILIPELGISSVKLYMTYEPLRLGDADLFNIMMAARSLSLTTMVHAENFDIIDQIAKRLVKKGNTSTYYHGIARPQIAEAEATYRAISIAEVTDTPILLVHMSAPRAVGLVREAQARLLPIHAETCPHYLYLRSDKLRSDEHKQEDFEGAKHICAPPLRHDQKDLDEIWRALANGTFTIVSSDHAPSKFDHPEGKRLALKPGGGHPGHDGQIDFRPVPNGLPGVETRLPLIFNRTLDPDAPNANTKSEDEKIRISLPRFVQLTSTNPAKLYGLGDSKGSLLPGFDADIVIWHPPSRKNEGFTITNNKLHHSIDYTPFEGMKMRNWPRYVLLRGKLVWNMDKEPGQQLQGKKDFGQFLRRGKSTLITGQMGRPVEGMTADETSFWR